MRDRSHIHGGRARAAAPSRARRAAPASFSSREYRTGSGRFAADAPAPESLPFETIEKQRRTGQLSLADSLSSLRGASSSNSWKKKRKRASKNAPQEVTSKMPVGRLRQVIEVRKRVVGRDPRFSDLSGDLIKAQQEHQYSFLQGMAEKERDALRKEPGEEATAALAKLGGSRRKKKKSRRVVAPAASASGGSKPRSKKPYWEKKRVAKERALMEKFETLHASGGLDRFLAKKRKKNSQTDRKRFHKGGVAE